MFERRVKILLVLLLLIVGVLVLRVLQLQVLEHRDWDEKARASLKRQQLTNTIRGSIYDVRGRQIALDVASIDACIDYRVIQEPPDERWVREEARRRIRGRAEGLSRQERAARLAAEVAAVKTDIDAMWDLLGKMPGATPTLVQETRRSIIQRVETRRRIVWYSAYEQAMKQHESQDRPAWYKRWVAGSNAEAPQLADYETEVGEQLESHPILRNVSAEVNNYLSKNADRLPGLVLRPGIARSYPFGEAGAHLMGHINAVTREDLIADEDPDDLRQYLPSDQIGRTGLEGLFEHELRGRRGRLVRVGAGPATEESAPQPGADVRTTIDIELQRRIQELFAKAEFKVGDATETAIAHGAAVVIDVPTGEVRALASYPAYDPNTLDADYRSLVEDEINLPLMNRATMSMLEPGSTMKPLVGLGAITQGVIGPHDTVTCHGYLTIGGKQYTVGRCWTMTRQKTDHRYIPYADPHPTGNLDYTDALQRSCNVYFETCGDRLGIAGLSKWMDKFGLGRATGIGVSEATGRIPSQIKIPAYLTKSVSWFAGIGQGKVAATPLQMANVAATIARDGVWMRPRLVPTGTPLPKKLTTDGIPDRAELGLNTEAVRLAKEGMVKVVNTRAGTGKEMKRDDLLVAGKTGTAQAAPFTYRKRDENGALVRDDTGRIVREELQLSTRDNPNPRALWYRGTGSSGTDRAHAWFIGFVPAEKPQIAFCVLVEYGGSGGTSAAPIANKIVQACVDADYLPGKKSGDTAPKQQQVSIPR